MHLFEKGQMGDDARMQHAAGRESIDRQGGRALLSFGPGSQLLVRAELYRVRNYLGGLKLSQLVESELWPRHPEHLDELCKRYNRCWGSQDGIVASHGDALPLHF